MRRMLIVLLVWVCAATASLPRPAMAAVPNRPFTATQCESYSDSVARLYTAGLGREPEQGGFDFWITEYTLGNWTFPRMAQFFVESPEFAASYGTLTQDGFIRQLYRNVLGREGEAGGVQFWNEQMSTGMNRATVLMRFAESPENIARSGTVEPTLGAFNEGRDPGPWRCGGSLVSYLLTATDLEGGWVETSPPARQPAGTGCESSLRLPDDIDQRSFVLDVGFDIEVTHALYIAPTEYGAQRYLEQVRDALDDCAEFVDSTGAEVSMSPLPYAYLGDDVGLATASLNARTAAPGLLSTHHVAVQVGSAVSVITYTSAASSLFTTTVPWAELTVERLRGLPQN